MYEKEGTRYPKRRISGSIYLLVTNCPNDWRREQLTGHIDNARLQLRAGMGTLEF
jgi:hypothetical protein